jgi:hypothetical protein
LSGGRLRVSAIIGVLAFAVAHAGVAQRPAWAQSASEERSSNGSARARVLEARVKDRDAALRERIGETTAVGHE